MTKDEALKLALEALVKIPTLTHGILVKLSDVEVALHKALAQPEQEPVALETVYETIIQWDEGGGKRSRRELARRIVDLYTSPPQRQPLTDEQIDNATRKQVDALLDHIYEYGTAAEGSDFRVRAIARAIEAAHGSKEKNK